MIIGTDLIGSGVSQCLSTKVVILVYYNRTGDKSMKIANEFGGLVHDTARSLIEGSEVVIAFLPTDTSLISVVSEIVGQGILKHNFVFINASTITPSTSVFISKALREVEANYVEAPVYGSIHEARKCNLISIVAREEKLYKTIIDILHLYSPSVFYVDELPKAMVLKLALNNIGLTPPVLIAESSMLIEPWGIEHDLFKNIIDKLWFKNLVERYWERIFNEKPARFKVWMAGKDYEYISRAIKDRNLPSILADALSNMYYNASNHGFLEKDYSQVARYNIAQGRKTGR
ncbi:MAG: NAD(P)-binding domain-containing protein [Desulfurococcaceae archaeon]